MSDNNTTINSDEIGWINNFQVQYGRKPRILHIGNIAQNAYQNAKMLNSAGCDCDVLCNDYYHIMGCPEWDDANFTGEIENQFYPDWTKVDLHGYKRPRWFVQGSFEVCSRYLIAKRKKKKLTQTFYWFILELERKKLCHDNSSDKEKFSFYSFCYKSMSNLYIKVKHSFVSIKQKNIFRNIVKTTDNSNTFNEMIDEKVRELENQFKKYFPDRECIFGDIARSYIAGIGAWKNVLQYYDIIQGYATSAIWPYLANVKNYVAYEHGTLRDLPYQSNDISRLLLLSFANAKSIILTNIDNIESAKYITKFSKAKIVYGLHGIDIDRITEKFDLIEKEIDFDGRFGVPLDEKLFFAPARHDYIDELGGFLKGTEKIVAAAAMLKRDTNKFKVVFVNFGNDVDRTKKLINNIPHLADNIIWTEPLSKGKLYKAFLHSDAILDQFVLHAFGAIAIEAMCTRKAALLIDKMDKKNIDAFFDEPMPVLFCDSTEEIYLAMKLVNEGGIEYHSIIEQAYEWVKKYHSCNKIVEKNCLSYSYCDFVYGDAE